MLLVGVHDFIHHISTHKVNIIVILPVCPVIVMVSVWPTSGGSGLNLTTNSLTSPPSENVVKCRAL